MNERIASIAAWCMLALIALRPSLDVTTGLQVDALGGVNPAALTGIALILLSGLWLVCLPHQQRWQTMTLAPVLLWAVFLLFLLPWAVIPFFAGEEDHISGIREWVRLVSILPVVMLACHAGRMGTRFRFVIVLILSLIPPALTGFYQLVAGDGQMVLGIHRIQGTFVHPNPFAFYLVTMLVVLYASARMSRSYWLWGIIVLTLVLLAGTLSFTGAGMFAVAAGVLALGESRTVRRGVMLMLVVFVTVFLATDAGRERVQELARWDNLDEIEATGQETPSHVWRVLNWRFLYREWVKQPVFGYGLASIPRVNPNLNVYKNDIGHDAHNDYIRFLVETGAVGAVGWLLFLAGMVRVYWLQYRKNPSVTRVVSLAALALLAAWLAGSMNDNLIQATAYQYVMWSALGLAYGISSCPVDTEPCG